VPVYLVQMPPDAEDTQADLYRFWEFLKQFRVVIGATAMAVTLIAIAYAAMAETKYRAEVVVSSVQSPDQQGGLGALASQFGGVASLIGLNFGGGAEKEQAIAVLRSRAFTEQMIRDKNLLPVLFADDWDGQTESWKLDKGEDYPTMADAYKKFDQDIRGIREDPNTGLITLSIDWADRKVAAEWANHLIERLNNHLREIAIHDANTNIEYLNAELERSSGLELRQAISHLIEQQIEIAMVANTRREFAFKVLDPAVPADDDDHIWPLRPVIVVFGAVAGVLLGIAFALILSAISPRHRTYGLAVDRI
jgi:uncharacterized protein involved in exopolysaccharide biosynthesis